MKDELQKNREPRLQGKAATKVGLARGEPQRSAWPRKAQACWSQTIPVRMPRGPSVKSPAT